MCNTNIIIFNKNSTDFRGKNVLFQRVLSSVFTQKKTVGEIKITSSVHKRNLKRDGAALAKALKESDSLAKINLIGSKLNFTKSKAQPKDRYVKLQKSELNGFKSKFTLPMLVLLRRFSKGGKGEINMSLRYFNCAIGATSDRYLRPANLKKLLAISLKELNAKTGVAVKLTSVKIKKGRICLKFKDCIDKKKGKKRHNYTFKSAEKKELFDKICDLSVDPQAAARAVRELDPGLIKASIKRSEKNDILNQANFLYKTLSIKCASLYADEYVAKVKVLEKEAAAPEDETYPLPKTLKK